MAIRCYRDWAVLLTVFATCACLHRAQALDGVPAAAPQKVTAIRIADPDPAQEPADASPAPATEAEAESASVAAEAKAASPPAAAAVAEGETDDAQSGPDDSAEDDTCPCPHCADCTCEKMRALQKAVAGSHKVLFYDNNFDYLRDPCYDGRELGDVLKRIPIGEHITVDVGGQFRLREHTERRIRPAVINGRPTGGLTGRDDDFLLQRTRLYVNTEIGERFRVYAETTDAQSGHERFPARAIEENRWELQNLFADAVVWRDCGESLTARVGRQELLYGSQRLISPLDWANFRRTFDGAKLIWKTAEWDVDGFWVRPLVPNVDRLDSPNLKRELYGLFSTYKGWGPNKLDLYWLGEDWHDPPTTPPGFDYQTAGARYYGSHAHWLYEAEGGYQFGTNSDKTRHEAGFFTVGLGRQLVSLDWKPTVWAYYDWASGDRRRGDGFNHYEPFGHYYLGFMDFFGRSNIEDVNLQVTLEPTEHVKLLAWYHYFRLQNGNDVPYNLDMSPYANLPAGSAGSRELGHEIDLTALVLLTPRTSVLFGYSHFFAGQFYKTTPSLPYRGDADFLYTQFVVNF